MDSTGTHCPRKVSSKGHIVPQKNVREHNIRGGIVTSLQNLTSHRTGTVQPISESFFSLWIIHSIYTVHILYLCNWVGHLSNALYPLFLCFSWWCFRRQIFAVAQTVLLFSLWEQRSFSLSAVVTPLLPFLKWQSQDMTFFMGLMQLSF
jgi:hypothetical protein